MRTNVALLLFGMLNTNTKKKPSIKPLRDSRGGERVILLFCCWIHKNRSLVSLITLLFMASGKK